MKRIEYLDAVALTAWVREVYEGGLISEAAADRLMDDIRRTSGFTPRGQVPVLVLRARASA
jgi:hypothetical protein